MRIARIRDSQQFRNAPALRGDPGGMTINQKTWRFDLHHALGAEPGGLCKAARAAQTHTIVTRSSRSASVATPFCDAAQPLMPAADAATSRSPTSSTSRPWKSA